MSELEKPKAHISNDWALYRRGKIVCDVNRDPILFDSKRQAIEAQSETEIIVRVRVTVEPLESSDE